jgi:hypothetical protein
MASSTSNGRLVFFMATDTRSHINGPFHADRLHLIHLAMTPIAGNLGRPMRRMAKEHEIGQLVNAPGGNAVDHTARNPRAPVAIAFMTRQAHFRRRKTRELGLQRARMAVDTLQLQSRMTLVAERNRLGAKKRYGNQKATSESEYVLLYLLPPPAAITTNCLPVFLPT